MFFYSCLSHSDSSVFIFLAFSLLPLATYSSSSFSLLDFLLIVVPLFLLFLFPLLFLFLSFQFHILLLLIISLSTYLTSLSLPTSCSFYFLLSPISFNIFIPLFSPPPPPPPSYLLQPAFTSIDTELYSLQSIIFPFVFICFHCLRNTKKFAKFHNFLVTWLKILVTKAALYYQWYSKFYIDFKRGFFIQI